MNKNLSVTTRSMIPLLLLGLLLCAPCAQAKDLRGQVESIVEKLLADSPVKGLRIATGEFRDPAGRVSSLSTLLSEDFAVALTKKAKVKNFQLIDRRNIEELSKEWKLGMLGAVDAASAQQAGKLLGVDAFLMGKYTDTGKKLIISASLVNTQTGQILAAESGDIKAEQGLRDLSQKYAKTESEPAAAVSTEALKVELWTDQKEHKIGEKMKVYVKASQDCYLTLIDVGTSGDATVIFPNNYTPSNAAKAGATYTIPDPTAGFEFEISGPAGLELIRAIASKEPVVDLTEAMQAFNSENPFGGVKDPPVLTRNIHVTAKKAKPGDWAEAVLRVTILPEDYKK